MFNNHGGSSGMKIPTSLIVCVTVIFGLELVGVGANIATGRDAGPFISYVTQFNGWAVAAGMLFWKQHKTETVVQDVKHDTHELLNGAGDEKLTRVLEDTLPPLVGAILDARGLPVRESGHGTHHTPPDATG